MNFNENLENMNEELAPETAPEFDQSLDDYIANNRGMFWMPLRRNRNQRYRRNDLRHLRQQQQQNRQQQRQQQQESPRQLLFLHRTQNQDLNLSTQIMQAVTAPWHTLQLLCNSQEPLVQQPLVQQPLVQQPLAQRRQQNAFQIGQRQVTVPQNGVGCVIRVGGGLQQQQQPLSMSNSNLFSNNLSNGSGSGSGLGSGDLDSPARRISFLRPSPLSGIQQRLERPQQQLLHQVESTNMSTILPGTISADDVHMPFNYNN